MEVTTEPSPSVAWKDKVVPGRELSSVNHHIWPQLHSIGYHPVLAPGRGVKAYDLYLRMKEEGFQLNAVTFVSVLNVRCREVLVQSDFSGKAVIRQNVE